jgi:hypothetical protein
METIWKYLRGDMPAHEFDTWACAACDSLKTMLGDSLWLQVVSTDYSKGEEEFQLRKVLQAYAESMDDSKCMCTRLSNVSVVDMGADAEKVFRTLTKNRQRPEPVGWLSLCECAECRGDWLVAKEEQNDVFILVRLRAEQREVICRSGKWPNILDRYMELLRIGKNASRVVRSIAEAATESPGIGVEQIAAQLNLESTTARALCKLAAYMNGVQIDIGS